MNKPLENAGLSQQLAFVAAGLCLLVSCALVSLGAISSRHMQLQQQAEFGSALAHQIARRIGAALETGDLLGIAASLQHFVETSSADHVAIYDVEGKALGQAGQTPGQRLMEYRAPVRIESDIAGEVVIAVSADDAQAAHLRFVLSLSGLAVLLSLAVYGTSRHLGQRLANRLTTLSGSIALDHPQDTGATSNELAILEANIAELPMDLLRTRGEVRPRDENYRSTAVLYLQLHSLSHYVATVDEQSLQNYTDRLHQMIYAAAGFYSGDLQVCRQFGLAVYFSEDNSAGSPAFRAASCAWLIRSVSVELQKEMSLSLSIGMAIGESELGVGDASDIYPGLYIQHTLDELQMHTTDESEEILLSAEICQDMDVSARLQHVDFGSGEYRALQAFAGPYEDLLERQMRLTLKRLGETPVR